MSTPWLGLVLQYYTIFNKEGKDSLIFCHSLDTEVMKLANNELKEFDSNLVLEKRDVHLIIRILWS